MTLRRTARLGTRPSLLAVAQSGLIADALSRTDPGLDAQLVPISTPGDRDRHTSLCQAGRGDFFSADIDAALASRKSVSRNKKMMTLGEAEMHFAKATILKKLGRPGEAGEERMIAEQSFAWLKRQRPTGGQTEKPPSYARGGVPVGVYDDLLRRVRLGLPGEGK